MDPLAELRAIREAKAALRMRADEMRWEAEVQRDEGLSKSVGAELSAAAVAAGRPLHAARPAYQFGLGGLGGGFAAGRGAAGGRGSLAASELREIRARSGLRAEPGSAAGAEYEENEEDEDLWGPGYLLRGTNLSSKSAI